MPRSEIEKDVFFLYRTCGMSMFPYICDGETLVVRKVGADEIQCGDIILFATQNAAGKIAHFVGKKYTEAGSVFFQTRSSRSKALEEPVGLDQVAGKVMALKRGVLVFDLDASGRRNFLYRLSCSWCRCVYGLKKTAAGLLRVFKGAARE